MPACSGLFRRSTNGNGRSRCCQIVLGYCRNDLATSRIPNTPYMLRCGILAQGRNFEKIQAIQRWNVYVNASDGALATSRAEFRAILKTIDSNDTRFRLWGVKIEPAWSYGGHVWTVWLAHWYFSYCRLRNQKRKFENVFCLVWNLVMSDSSSITAGNDQFPWHQSAILASHERAQWSDLIITR